MFRGRNVKIVIVFNTENPLFATCGQRCGSDGTHERLENEFLGKITSNFDLSPLFQREFVLKTHEIVLNLEI